MESLKVLYQNRILVKRLFRTYDFDESISSSDKSNAHSFEFYRTCFEEILSFIAVNYSPPQNWVFLIALENISDMDATITKMRCISYLDHIRDNEIRNLNKEGLNSNLSQADNYLSWFYEKSRIYLSQERDIDLSKVQRRLLLQTICRP